MSRRIVILETVNSCARLSYVSCRLKHNTSNRRWRRSDRLMFSPPFRCSLPPMVNSKVFLPGTHKKNYFGNLYMDWILALCDLQKSECGGIQISKEVHGTGKKQRVSTQNDKINRQIAWYAFWRFLSTLRIQRDNTLWICRILRFFVYGSPHGVW